MKKWNRIAIKVGTSTICHPSGRLNIRTVEKLVRVLSDLANASNEIILISSGAISMGVGKLNLDKKPDDIVGKQACAAVGQCELMYVYDKLFSQYNHNVAQVLLTGEDLDSAERKASFQNTMFKLLKYHAIPILNENDTMSTTEITSIGDNDTLAALVAKYTECDLLVLLSDIDGLYTSDPHTHEDARLITHVTSIDQAIRDHATDTNSSQGTGGMITKLNAAQLCMENGIDMIIANGEDPSILYDIMDNKPVGTLFEGEEI